MDDTRAVLRLEVSEPDADDLRIDELARSLRRELLDAGSDAVTAESAGPAPEGSRGLDPVTVGTLLVSIASSALTLTQAVETVRGWLRGASKDCKVVVELEGKSVTLTGGTAREQRRLVNDTIAALHAATPPSPAGG